MCDDLISIVIPVYQAELYVQTCVDSLLNQTYSNTEIILVDDGSTDNSLHIITGYANFYENIYVFHKSNGGASSARNYGLNHINGQYVIFIDADDYVEPDFCEKLLYEIKKVDSDIVITGIDTHLKPYFNNSQNIVFQKNCFSQMLNEWFSLFTFNSSCGNIYKAEIVKKVRFPDGVRLGEDLIYNLSYLMRCQSVDLYNYCGYKYRMNAASATKKYFEGDYENQIFLLNFTSKALKQLVNDEEFDTTCCERVFLYNCIDIYTILVLNDEQYNVRDILRTYIDDNCLVEIVHKSQPHTLQRKLMKYAVEHGSIRLLMVIGKIKKMKARIGK